MDWYNDEENNGYDEKVELENLKRTREEYIEEKNQLINEAYNKTKKICDELNISKDKAIKIFEELWSYTFICDFSNEEILKNALLGR